MNSSLIHLGLFGTPLDHSLSPVLHKEAAQLSPFQMEYHLLPSSQSGFPSLLKNSESIPLLGANVTAPHKRLAYQHSTQHTLEASCMKAVNTLKWEGTHWEGHNTDLAGLLYSLKGFSPRSVLLLGAGGAAQSVFVANSSMVGATLS